MEKLLELLQFPLQLEGVEIKVVVDIKLLVVLIGLHGTSCRYNCPYCEVYLSSYIIIPIKLSFENSKGCRGNWIDGSLDPRRAKKS